MPAERRNDEPRKHVGVRPTKSEMVTLEAAVDLLYEHESKRIRVSEYLLEKGLQDAKKILKKYNQTKLL